MGNGRGSFRLFPVLPGAGPVLVWCLLLRGQGFEPLPAVQALRHGGDFGGPHDVELVFVVAGLPGQRVS